MLIIINIYTIFVENTPRMKTKKNILFPKHQKIMEQIGENIKLARKRRKLTMVQVAERAGIDRTTFLIQYLRTHGSRLVIILSAFEGDQDDLCR